jgi:hypothetical protein
MPVEARRAISGLDIEVRGDGDVTVKKVKFWSKTSALDSLARHLRLFEPEAQHEDRTIIIETGVPRVPDAPITAKVHDECCDLDEDCTCGVSSEEEES